MDHRQKIGFLIIDMSEEQFHPNGKPIIPNWPGHAKILSLAKALGNKDQVFDSRLWMDPDTTSSLHQLYPEVGLNTSPGAKLCHELSELGPISTFVKKVQYSSFYGSPLSDLLEKEGIGILMLAGINTDWCVFASALDAFYRGLEVWLIEEACTSISGKSGHNRGVEEFQRFLGHKGKVMNASNALERIKGRLNVT